MIKLNGKETDYRPGTSLREVAEKYYSDVPIVTFDDFIVIVNNKALTSSQAEEYTLIDNDSVSFVPKLEGG